MLAFRKEPVTSKVNGLDEIWLRDVPCELVDNDAATGLYILEKDKPFQPLGNGCQHLLTFC